MTVYNEMHSNKEIQDTIKEFDIGPVKQSSLKPKELHKTNAGVAIERHQWHSYQNFLQWSSNNDEKEIFARNSSEEEAHLCMMTSAYDPENSPIQAAISVQMSAVETFSSCAQLEQNEACKTTYDYLLLDHVEQLSQLCNQASKLGVDPQTVLNGEIKPMSGRPLNDQFVPSKDLIKRPVSFKRAQQSSLVNSHIAMAAEKILHDETHVFRTFVKDKQFRNLCANVTAIENLHIDMLGSTQDPKTTPLEFLLINELCEIRAHQLGAQLSKHQSLRQAHEHALEEDQGHLEQLLELYKRQGKSDPTKFQITDELFQTPELSTNDYVRQIIESELGMTPSGSGFMMAA